MLETKWKVHISITNGYCTHEHRGIDIETKLPSDGFALFIKIIENINKLKEEINNEI